LFSKNNPNKHLESAARASKAAQLKREKHHLLVVQKITTTQKKNHSLHKKKYSSKDSIPNERTTQIHQ
jgi:hypothetical protein